MDAQGHALQDSVSTQILHVLGLRKSASQKRKTKGNREKATWKK